MEKEYTIKITGSGTFAGIMNTLRSVANEMDLILESGQTPPNTIEWEDPILMTEINEDETGESGPFDQLGYEQTKEE